VTYKMALPFALIMTLLAITPSAFADAREDLDQGTAALNGGEPDKALKLLESAAERLPQSVEAQFALGQCYLQLGDLNKALVQFQAVVKLSPNHSRAKTLVNALSGRRTSFDQQIAHARTLATVGSYSGAQSVLVDALKRPLEPKQRFTARLLLAEYRLWDGKSNEQALANALELLGQTNDASITGPANVIAAMALMALPEQKATHAQQYLIAAGNVGQPWQSHIQTVQLLIQLKQDRNHADISNKLAAPLAATPESRFKYNLVKRLVDKLTGAAKKQLNNGQTDSALAIAWPMVHNQPVPGADAVGKPLELSGGWLGKSESAQSGWSAAYSVLSSLAQTHGQNARLSQAISVHWLASQVAAQMPGKAAGRDDLTLHTIEQLAAYSRPAPDRNPGSVLSAADALQRTLIINAAPRFSTRQSRQRLVQAIGAHINRYAAVDDTETGVRQFVEIKPAVGNQKASVTVLVKLPIGSAHKQLLGNLASKLAKLGLDRFNRLAATIDAQANSTLNSFDVAAIGLYRVISVMYPTDKSAASGLTTISERYIGINQWDAAAAAIALFYSDRENDTFAGRWALIQLKLRRATEQENKLLAARHKLPAAINASITESLTEAVNILKANPTSLTRRRATSIAQSVVNRYASLSRMDLAEATIAAVVAAVGQNQPEEANLNDWAKWARADLLEYRANSALVQLVKQANDQELKLHALHQAELQLLGQIITQHAQSDYVGSAVSRIMTISSTYQRINSFATATSVLSDFLKAHPKMKSAQRLEYQMVAIRLAKARHVFAKRKDKKAVPQQISDEYGQAIDALTAFLKAHPTDAYAPTAENELLQIARVYGQVGAWPVARQVVLRIGQAVPDFRSPGHLKILEAATFLGELDKNYGLKLLQSAPVTTPSADRPGGFDGLAKLDEEHRNRSALKPPKTTTATRPSAKPNLRNNTRNPSVTADPSARDTAVAMIRRSEQQQLAQIARLQGRAGQAAGQGQRQAQQGGQVTGGVALPGGKVLSDAAMKKQDEASDKAYAILIALINQLDQPANAAPEAALAARHARAHLMWMIGFFESQLRHDRAIVIINQLLKDRPNDSDRIALAFRAVTDQLTFASNFQQKETINQAWVDQRHQRFEKARADIDAFITTYQDKSEWANQARFLLYQSYQREADLVAIVSHQRAGGLLVQAVNQLLGLLQQVPAHPNASSFPNNLWAIAQKLRAMGQSEQAIYVFNRLTVAFPTHSLAAQSVLQIAQTYSSNLSSPLRAVEAYQEFLSLNGDNASIRTNIYNIASQLSSKRRYLEALHVYAVFVDSFPTDPRAAQSLQAIGRIHQTNEIWNDAIAAYQRIIDEYPKSKILATVRLAIAECQINLSEWRLARKLYEEYLQAHSKDSQVQMARTRIDVLKNLDRYQKLLADDKVQRNKDDAQFQIGTIVLQRLGYRRKAIREFRKVVSEHAKSHLADDAQLEIGKALLSLNDLDAARKELLKVPLQYPNSSLADNALYLIGQSFQNHAVRLASVTVQLARAEAYEKGQRDAYRFAQKAQQEEEQDFKELQRKNKKAGDRVQFDLNQALSNTNSGGRRLSQILGQSRGAQIKAETESALEVANRQDRINDAYRQAVSMYAKAASDYPLGDRTSESLLRMAEIYETRLKDRKQAMLTYQKIVKFFPGTPVAENASWHVAQFHEEESKYDQAVVAYRDFIRNYPASKRVADAQFAMAEALEQLGRWVEAMDAYQTFREKFAKHTKAKAAADQINWIKAYRR